MHSVSRFLILATAGVLAVIHLASAQNSPARGKTIAPPSTTGIPGLPRTPLYFVIPDNNNRPDGTLPAGETPASIACIYGVTAPTPGCPQNGTVVPAGGAKAIAVVEWGINSTLTRDAAKFSKTFGLAKANLTVVCAEPPCASNDRSGWDVETALDVEWAHAMAPNAHIYVVVFMSDPLLGGAEQKAAQLVAAAGGGEVSNSWIYSSEFYEESLYDTFFIEPGVVFFASAGDNAAGPLYPSVSPNLISAGGTSVFRDGSGNFSSESCWSESGGGPSQYEALPSYQNVIAKKTHNHRGTPDLAAVADPNTGVLVYNTTYCGGWCVVGGTSVSSPVLAGITNAAGGFASSTSDELTKVYGEYASPTEYKSLFNDIIAGSNGYLATKGWDFCTGVGTPKTPTGE